MNALDLVLVVLAVAYALTGFRQGFLVGSCSMVGLLGGGLIGIRLAPWALEGLQDTIAVSAAAMLVVLLCAFAGQAIGTVIGVRLRGWVTWQPARFADAVSGAALSVVALLVMAWVLGVAASSSQLEKVNEEVRGSVVLGAVDKAMPGGTEQLMSAFDAVVGSSGFPRYLEPFATERIVAVPAPNNRLARTPAVRRAGDSVVKILGNADGCDKTFEGSGFVFAPGRVMTNAHVVAGVDSPLVRLADTDHNAHVVYYDPDTDVAVLSVPGLSARPLQFAGPAQAGRSGAVLGYPLDGPYDVEPARIRSVEHLRSPDIYGDGQVSRDVYSLYSTVRQGNSGGPLVAPNGRVLGVVFAASLVDGNTGYALTAGEVADAAAAGAKATRSVDTGDCAL